jgi:hypothetical protein
MKMALVSSSDSWWDCGEVTSKQDAGEVEDKHKGEVVPTTMHTRIAGIPGPPSEHQSYSKKCTQAAGR